MKAMVGPDTMRTQIINRPRQAFTLIGLIAIVVIVLLVAVLLPILIRTRAKSQRAQCVENLKQIGLSFRAWAGGSGDRYSVRTSTNDWGTLEYAETTETFRHFQVLSNELRSPQVLVCPTDSLRRPAKSFAAGFSTSNVSYFVGVDADEPLPEALLSGDRNITNGLPFQNQLMILTTNNPGVWRAGIHGKGQGNLGLSDGSVQLMDNAALQRQIKTAGQSRLALP